MAIGVDFDVTKMCEEIGKLESDASRMRADKVRLKQRIGELEATLGVCQAAKHWENKAHELECRIAEQVLPAASVGKITDFADEDDLRQRLDKEANKMDELLIEGYTHEQAEAVSELINQCLGEWKIELWRLEKNIERCQIFIAGFEAEIAHLKRICEAHKSVKEEGEDE